MRGGKPKAWTNKAADGLEAYDWGRYFTITGEVWESSPSLEIPNVTRACLLAFYRKHAPAQSKLEPASGGSIPGGERNSALTSIAGKMRRIGLCAKTIRAVLLVENSRCDPPLDEKEVASIARSVGKYEPEATVSAAPTRHDWPLIVAGETDHSKARPYAFDGLLYAGGLGILYGSPGTLKTGIAIDMGIHKAQGEPWRTHKTTRGAGFIIAAEGGGGVAGRLDAAYAAHPDWGKSFVAIPKLVNLLQRETVEAFAEHLHSKFVRRFGPPTFGVFDTLSQNTPGGEENPTTDIGLAEAHSRWLMSEFPTLAILWVHHPGKDSSKGPRGSSLLGGNLDLLLLAERVDRGDVQRPFEERLYLLSVEKNKDGRDDIQHAYGGEVYEIAKRKEDGKPVQAVRVAYKTITEAQGVRAKGKARKPKSRPAAIMKLLTTLSAHNGAQAVPREVLERSGYLAGAENFTALRHATGLRRDILAERIADLQVAKEDAERETVVKRCREAVMRLIRDRTLVLAEGWVWIDER